MQKLFLFPNTRFLYQQQSPESVDVYSESNISLDEQINAHVDDIYQLSLEGKFTDAQNLIDEKLEPLLEQLDTPEDVKAALQRLTQLPGNKALDFDKHLSNTQTNEGTAGLEVQETIEKDNINSYLRKNPKKFITTEGLMIDGEKYTLKDALENDFSSVDLSVIATREDLQKALDEAASKGRIENSKLSYQNFENLYALLHNINDAQNRDRNVGLLQKVLAELDSSLDSEMQKNGEVGDNKYGYATSNAVRLLATNLSNYVENNVEVTLPRPQNNEIFANRDRINLVLDVSSSMQDNEYQQIAKYIKTNYIDKGITIPIAIHTVYDDSVNGGRERTPKEAYEELTNPSSNLRQLGGRGDPPEPLVNAARLALKKMESSPDMNSAVIVFSDAPSKPGYGDNWRNTHEGEIEELTKLSEEKTREVYFMTPEDDSTVSVASGKNVLDYYKEKKNADERIGNFVPSRIKGSWINTY